MKSIFLIAIMFCHIAVYAQKSVSSTVVDENKEPIAGAVVQRIDRQSDRVINYVLSDVNGKFNIAKFDANSQKIRIEFFGYKPYEFTGEATQIILEPMTNNVGEVVVTAKKSSVTQTEDRLIFLLGANSNLTKGASGQDILKFTPMVEVDGDKISVVGKSKLQLYINGRKSNFSGDAVTNYLKSLPADKIEKIEVITNPDATYRSDGTMGIINLVLHKNETDGMKGTVTISDEQGYYNSPSATAYLNFQKNKFNATASLYGLMRNYKKIGETDYYYYDAKRHNNISDDWENIDGWAGASLNMDYNISDTKVIGAIFNFDHRNLDNYTKSNTIYRQLNLPTIDSTQSSSVDSHSPSDYFSANINYRSKTDKLGSTFTIDVDYALSRKYNSMYNDFGQVKDITPDSKFRQLSNDKIDNFTMKIERKRKFNASNTLTYGIEAYNTQYSTDFFYGNWNGNDYVSDPKKSNQFDYKEYYAAAYATYNRVWSKKIVTTLGVRTEYQSNNGLQRINFEKTNHEYFNVLPSLSVMYNISKKSSMVLNFQTRNVLPKYSAMNPFVFYLTPTTYKEYNPDLKPSTSYMTTLSYTYNRSLTFTLNYMFAKNITNNFLIPVDDVYTKYVNTNFGDGHLLMLVGNWSNSLFKGKLNYKLTAIGTYNSSKGKVEEMIIDVNSLAFQVDLSASYNLSKARNWNLDFRYRFNSAMQLAQENVSPSHNIDLSLRKVFRNKMSLKFGANSIIDMTDIRDKDYQTYAYSTTTKYFMRRYFVTFSIPFGNQKARGSQGKGNSESQKSRIEE